MEKNVEKNTEGKRAIPPYLSYKTFTTFLERLKITMPSRIDRSLMGSMSGSAQSELFTALRFLDLISPNELPTEKLTKLVNSEGVERQKILTDILKSSYRFLFQDGFELQRATGHQLVERFSDAGASGATVRKGISFFIAAAKDAGIDLSPHIKVTGPRSVRSKPRRLAHVSDAAPIEDNFEQKSIDMSWQQLLLSKFPSFDPAWSPEVQAKWFDGFKELMEQFKEQTEQNE